jgi:hypothetical protein
MGTLIGRLGVRAKDQGDRPTCVAFAASCLHEYWCDVVLDGKEEVDLDLSEEFLHYGCKQGDGLTGEAGTTVTAARDWLEGKGQCLEQLHPYSKISGPLLTPSQAAFADARRRTLSRLVRLQTKWDILERALKGDSPVLGVVRIFENAYHVDSSGLLPLPKPGDGNLGLHAVVFLDIENHSLGSQVVFVNSWGRRWGDAGLGRFGTEYFDKYCQQLWIVRKGTR